MKNKFLFLLILILATKSFCQKDKNSSYKIIENLRSFNLENIPEFSTSEEEMLDWQYNFVKNYSTKDSIFNRINFIDKKKINTNIGKVFYNINLGDYHFYNSFDKDQISFQFYKIALEYSLSIKDKILICESLKKILTYYENIIHLDDTNYKVYLELYNKNTYDDKEKSIYNYFKITLEFKNSSQSITRFDLEKALELEKKFTSYKLTYYLGKILRQLGVFYDLNKEYTKSLNKYNKANNTFSNLNYKMAEEQLMMVYINMATVYLEKNDYETSINLLEKAKFNRLNKIYNKNYRYLYYWLSESYLKKRNHKKALEYLKLSHFIEDSLKQYKHTIQIADIETKYQSEKKEKENLKLKQDNLEIESKRKQNRNLLIGSILFIAFGGSIAYLNLKNSRKKRLIAQQQNELEQQKNLTLIKEQEITTINAMVDGQEKERIRIAEDLHDNLGSVLATLKLHFENLQMNKEKKKINQDELFNKTESLIDEAYLKVRSIAHAKNSGVIANQGLLTAVKMMAEKISSADKIQIEVIHFGLDNRLENTLEINVFRIIQELITNVIKHAEANTATINISSYDNNLNVIVEDDGLGFDIKKVNIKDGMGISSIKTRIEHLNGTFEVDSTVNKGTSIIIDIPIT